MDLTKSKAFVNVYLSEGSGEGLNAGKEKPVHVNNSKSNHAIGQ